MNQPLCVPVNRFKQALAAKQTQLGLWLALAEAQSAELLAGLGYDWLLIDGEHAPNDLRQALAQIRAIEAVAASTPPGAALSHPVVRLPIGDTVLIKQYLDIGAQSLLIPMVETAEQAAELVRATRYPPAGIRGMGPGNARSSRWQRFPRYIHEADNEICLLVQVESVQALERIDAIAAVPGVDGVFIGPTDLSASMGLAGQIDHPKVKAAIDHGLQRIRAAGKAPGILATVEARAREVIAAGAQFVAIGSDTALLANGAKGLLGRVRGGS